MNRRILVVSSDDPAQLGAFITYLKQKGFKPQNEARIDGLANCISNYISVYENFIYAACTPPNENLYVLPQHWQFAVDKINHFIGKASHLKDEKKSIMDYYDIYEGDFVRSFGAHTIYKVTSIEYVSSIHGCSPYSHRVRKYFEQNGPHWIVCCGSALIPIDSVEKLIPTNFKVITDAGQYQPVIDSNGDLITGCITLNKEHLDQIQQVAEFCDLNNITLAIDNEGAITYLAYADVHIEEPIALEDLEEVVEKINKNK